MSALQGAELEVYVPPTIHYARDGGGDTELFAIPITIANEGARSGTVISMELEVQNLKTNATKRYYSAFLGEHPREATALNRQFAPLSIAGHAVFTETVRFYPVGSALPRVVDSEGRICLPASPQHCGTAATLVPRSAQRPHAAGADRLPDDLALDLRSAARVPPRHHLDARKGVEGDRRSKVANKRPCAARPHAPTSRLGAQAPLVS